MLLLLNIKKKRNTLSILYFEEAYDAQSNRGYRQYSGPIDKNGGVASYKEQVGYREPDVVLTDAHRDNLITKTIMQDMILQTKI